HVPIITLWGRPPGPRPAGRPVVASFEPIPAAGRGRPGPEGPPPWRLPPSFQAPRRRILECHKTTAGDIQQTKTVLPSTLFGAGAITIRAQETPSPDRLTTDHYFELERISDAQISPDGAHIVYTRQQVNRLADKWESSLWIMNADGWQHR